MESTVPAAAAGASGEIGPSNPPSPAEKSKREEEEVEKLEESKQNTVTPDPPSTSEKRKREEEGDEQEQKQGEGEEQSEKDPVMNPYWKTSLCSYYRRQPAGECRHADACRYAHGEAELRQKPDNSWDPTSERAKKMLKLDEKEGTEKEKGEGEEGEGEGHVAVDESSMDKCLIGLSRKWNTDGLKSFLDGQGISYKTCKKKKGMTVGFLTFENTEQLRSAIQVLREHSARGKEIKIADAIKRSFEKKKENGEENGNENNNNNNGEENRGIDGGLVSLSSKRKSVREVVTPLAHLPYADQLEHKKSTLSQTLKRLTRNARKACPDALPLPDWILKARDIGGLPCKLEGILESPLTEGYRNKCEFSVGYSLDGKKTVGFMLGNFREGVTAVEQPVDCPNVSWISCKYALIFQEFLQNSTLPVWNRIENTGFWRQFTVREGRNLDQTVDMQESETRIREVMLIIQVCSTGVDQETMKLEFEKLCTALSNGAKESKPTLPLTTIVVQDHIGISNAAPADCPLIPLSVPEMDGPDLPQDSCIDKARIHDYIGNLKFSISPTAFFQVNTLAAERLYSLAGDWAELNSDTLLFDVCCGTGTIGLTLAHRVGMIVGIEMNESAVSDAERNAVINGLTNCRFVCAKAEDVMGPLLTEYLGEANQEAKNVNLSNNEGILAKSSEPMESEGNKSGSSNNGSMAELVSSNGSAEMETNDGADTKASVGPSTGDRRFKNVVAIVDPPRVGLHPTVIKALRTHPGIRRLVYISCNPDSLVANAIELCTPTSMDKPEKNKGNRGWRNMSSAGLARYRAKSMPNSEPFRPVRAKAVDLFPHTNHCEMVMLFER